MNPWVRWRENWPGFLWTFRIPLLVFISALLADAASTTYFMYQDYAGEELHPVVALAARWLGPVLGPLAGALGKGAAGLAVAVYLRRYALYIFITGSILSFWAAWYNVWGHGIYEPWFLKWVAW